MVEPDAATPVMFCSFVLGCWKFPRNWSKAAAVAGTPSTATATRTTVIRLMRRVMAAPRALLNLRTLATVPGLRYNTHMGRYRGMKLAVIGVLVLTCALAAPAGAADPWKSVSGDTDSVLIDIQTSIDGITHAVFLQHRTGDDGIAAYDAIDRPVAANGTLGPAGPIVAGWKMMNAARLIPTTRGLLAIIVGDPDGQGYDRTKVYRAPLGGGSWSEIQLENADELSGDTFFSDIVQSFLAIASSRLTHGPPIQAMPDGTLLYTELPYPDEITVRRVLGNDAKFTIDMNFPDDTE